MVLLGPYQDQRAERAVGLALAFGVALLGATEGTVTATLVGQWTPVTPLGEATALAAVSTAFTVAGALPLLLAARR